MIDDNQTVDADGAAEASEQAAVAAFHATVSEARKEAETHLASVVDKMRKAATAEREAEIAQLVDRHTKELEETRSTIEAQVRDEESQRHAADISRLREELGQRYTEDLQRARAARHRDVGSLSVGRLP